MIHVYFFTEIWYFGMRKMCLHGSGEPDASQKGNSYGKRRHYRM